MSKKHIIILGGDGYLGWPTALYFSKRNFDVTVVDNYFRRNSSKNLDTSPLFELPTLCQRVNIWHQKTGKEIKVVSCDLSDPSNMMSLFNGSVKYDWCVDKSYTGVPDTIVHYAEQPSAPYSMMSLEHSDYTITNNLRVTNNLLWAVKEFSPGAHIIKLGTMGEYGTPNIDIEEGWLNVKHKGREQLFLYPRQASSIYHTTKIMDTDLIWFAVRTWGLRVTDLMQGPVYGIETYETAVDARLRTIFNYDEIFGTVINRFVTQAVAGFPLSIYGKGGQTRGYINIKDTMQCMGASENNPPPIGELRVFNQITETFSVNQLAELISSIGIARGHKVKINRLINPRKEAEEHYYNPIYQGLLELGVKPHYLTTEFLHELFELVEQYKSSIEEGLFYKGITW